MSKVFKTVAIATIIAASTSAAFAQGAPPGVGYGPYYPTPGYYYSAVDPSSRAAMVDATGP
jgi:hypothetical protein